MGTWVGQSYLNNSNEYFKLGRYGNMTDISGKVSQTEDWDISLDNIFSECDGYVSHEVKLSKILEIPEVKNHIRSLLKSQEQKVREEAGQTKTAYRVAHHLRKVAGDRFMKVDDR